MPNNSPPSRTFSLPTERAKFTPSDLVCGQTIDGGSRSVVRHGYSTKFGNVAVKAYHKPLGAGGVEELKLLMKHGEHPNLVHVLGLFYANDDFRVCRGYVMEYMPIGLLEKYIHTTSIEYSTERANSWIHQIALGLSYLHEEGLLHRDLNPKRIYLGKFYDDLKIAHFGTAKTLEAKGEPLNGASLEHMAPEVIQKNEFSKESDVYSFATTIWEIIHRKKPYSHLGNVSNFELTSKIVGGERPQIEEGKVPEQVQVLLQRAWNCEPANRPTVSEFLEYARSSVGIRIVEDAMSTSSDKRPGAVAAEFQTEVPILLGSYNNRSVGILDVKANAWKRLSLRLPYTTNYNGAAFLNGEVYIFGGDSYGESKSAYKLNKNLVWKKLPDMNEGRYHIQNSSVVFDGCVWVIGGAGRIGESYNYLKTVEAYDPKSNSWMMKPEMHTARFDAAAAPVRGKIFVCGGYNGIGYNFLNTVEYFDPQLSKWTICTPLPVPRRGLATIVQDSFLIVMGGNDGESDTADVWRMNVDDAERKWSVMPSMKAPRSFFSAFTFGGKIMVAGGRDTTNVALSSVEIFDGKEWTEGPAMPIAMSLMAATSIPHSLAQSLLAKYPPV